MADKWDTEGVALLNRLKGLDLDTAYNGLNTQLQALTELPADDGVEDDDVPVDNFPDNPPKNDPSQPLTIPKLPPGTTLDLTLPMINIPNYPEFSIPAGLGVSASAIIANDPITLTQEQWMVIAKRTEVLLAYTMEKVEKDSNPMRAMRAALDWMVPESSTFFRTGTTGTVSTAVVYSEETASYVKAGFNKQSASFGCPFVAASFERESNEKLAQASHRKSVYLIGRWEYPRVTLRLEQCTKVSARFTDALAKALSCTTFNDIKALDPLKVTSTQQAALQEVFKTYGVALPQEIDLGGVLTYSSEKICEGSLEERDAELTIKIAAEAKYKGITGDAGCSFGLGEKTRITAESLSESMTMRATGGETLLADAPREWVPTVAHPEKWAVIAVRGFKPLIEWLDPETRDKLKQIWAYAQPAIGPLEELDTPDRVIVAASGSRFVLAARTAPDGFRGSITLACGKSITPNVREGAVGGEACFHRYEHGDRRIDRTSLCLPVPNGYRCAFTAPDTVGKGPTRLAMVDTQLTFGDWSRLELKAGEKSIAFTALTDGFVFCTISAPTYGDRGHVFCYINQTIRGAASVHHGNDNHIKNGATCVPVARGSQVAITWQKDFGNPQGEAWYLPCTSQGWRFEMPTPLSLNTRVPAETDGFVLVRINSANGPRGYVRVEGIPPGTRSANPNSIGAAAVHSWPGSDQWISWASLMVPIRKGYEIWSETIETSPGVQYQGYWTAIVPNTK